MKKKIIIHDRYGVKEKEIDYIPVRFIIAMLLIILETAAVIGITLLCGAYIPYFYLAMWATEIFCVLKIINSEENPDYKIPWLLVTLLIPVAGFMLYFMFYDRKLTKKQVKRINKLAEQQVHTDDKENFAILEKEDKKAYLQAKLLCKLSHSHLYCNTTAQYFPFGEDMNRAMLEDLKKAGKFIFLEYFIIEEGIFWNGIFEILKEKAAQGVEVRVVYDDVGCMLTLPGDYYKTLQSYGIKAVRFSPLKGQADNEFNNRSHRKIMVIDGKIGYTGGVNIADEYINEKKLFGKWKDVGIRLEGNAVKQLTSIFLADYELNVRTPVEDFSPYFNNGISCSDSGYVVPFGDGPRPMFRHRVAKTMIMNMLNQSQSYVYMMSPYLIIDNELCQAMENAAMRGVDVRIITPHIPDKKIVFMMTQSYYKRLTEAGVRIFEYAPGFVHAKVYLSDDEYGIVGTVNLDYRSLVHHFENGVWLYKHDVLTEIKEDMTSTMEQSIEMNESNIKDNILQRLIRSLVRIFSPML
ncbi:MAG: cardiolipin synthase [Oscillospiraceae bacterium]|nr:cardiolipin synthase [Oscillospiraceae bacterium]